VNRCLPLVLSALMLVLGAFAGWGAHQARAERNAPGVRNTALTDNGRTAEVLGQVTGAVERLFSYDHLDPEAVRKTAAELLTGDAVAQHERLFGPLRDAAPERGLVLTTTVSQAAVRSLTADRAHLLVFAEQLGTTADDPGRSTGAAAMLAVDAVRRDGRWILSGIDRLDD
jgi:Mce-associated membrane protein